MQWEQTEQELGVHKKPLIVPFCDTTQRKQRGRGSQIPAKRVLCPWSFLCGVILSAGVCAAILMGGTKSKTESHHKESARVRVAPSQKLNKESDPSSSFDVFDQALMDYHVAQITDLQHRLDTLDVLVVAIQHELESTGKIVQQSAAIGPKGANSESRRNQYDQYPSGGNCQSDPRMAIHHEVSSGNNKSYVGFVRALPPPASRVSFTSTNVAENGSWYGQPNAIGIPKTVLVRGYWRRNGTYVRGYYRSVPHPK